VRAIIWATLYFTKMDSPSARKLLSDMAAGHFKASPLDFEEL
jgi:hypothetical protein